MIILEILLFGLIAYAIVSDCWKFRTRYHINPPPIKEWKVEKGFPRKKTDESLVNDYTPVAYWNGNWRL